ncbi:hypothetical protein RCL1_006925 [Eukaryota sp. TZLM3-RCL]
MNTQPLILFLFVITFTVSFYSSSVFNALVTDAHSELSLLPSTESLRSIIHPPLYISKKLFKTSVWSFLFKPDHQPMYFLHEHTYSYATIILTPQHLECALVLSQSLHASRSNADKLAIVSSSLSQSDVKKLTSLGWTIHEKTIGNFDDGFLLLLGHEKYKRIVYFSPCTVVFKPLDHFFQYSSTILMSSSSSLFSLFDKLSMNFVLFSPSVSVQKEVSNVWNSIGQRYKNFEEFFVDFVNIEAGRIPLSVVPHEKMLTSSLRSGINPYQIRAISFDGIYSASELYKGDAEAKELMQLFLNKSSDY